MPIGKKSTEGQRSPAALSSPWKRAQSQRGSPVLTSPSHQAEIRSFLVSKTPRSPLMTSDKAGRDAGGEQSLALATSDSASGRVG